MTRLFDHIKTRAKTLDAQQATELARAEREKSFIIAFNKELNEKQLRAKNTILALKNRMEDSTHILSDQQKTALTGLIAQATRAVEMSRSPQRIEELELILSWTNNMLLGVVEGKACPLSERESSLLEKEIQKWGGFYNEKINRIIIGIASVALGAAIIGLSVYLAIQLFPIVEYSPIAFGIAACFLSGMSLIIFGLSSIFGDHEFSLSSELASVTKLFDLPTEQISKLTSSDETEDSIEGSNVMNHPTH